MADAQVQVVFQGGPDESLAQQLVPLGTVLSATNQVYDLDGQYSPRLGYTILSTTAPASVLKLAGLNSELLAVDGQILWGFDGTANAWIEKDGVPSMGVTHAPLQNSTSTYESWSEAVSGGYRVVAWTDIGSSLEAVRVGVYSTTTGALVSNSLLLLASGDTGLPRLVTVGVIGTIVIVTACTATHVYGWWIQTAPLGSWSAPVILSDIQYLGNSIYACCYLSDRFVISYEGQTGGTTYFLYNQSFDASLSRIAYVLTEIGTTNPSNSGWGEIGCIASTGSSTGAVWVAAFCNFAYPATGSDATFVAAFSPTSLNALSTNSPWPVVTLGTGADKTTRIVLATMPSSTTTVLFAANSPSITQQYGGPNLYGTVLGQVGINAIVTGMQFMASAWIASKPFYVAALGTHLMFMRQPQYTTPPTSKGIYPVFDFQGSYYLVDLLTNLTWPTPADELDGPLPRLLKVLAPQIVNMPDDSGVIGFTTTQFNSPAIVQSSATTLETVMPIARGTNRQGLELFTIDFGAAYRWSPAILGRELYFPDGYYDGGPRFVETGFVTKPMVLPANNYVILNPPHTWEYVATFLRVDTQGNVEESQPSDPVQVSSSSSSPSFVLDVTCLTLTQKVRWSDSTTFDSTVGTSSRIYIVLYRTQELQNGNTIHYRVNDFPFPAGQLNEIFNYSIAITDTASDDSIASNTTLYTDSGELAHTAPESATHNCVHQNALVQIGADQRSIWFSQTYEDGALPGWNPTNVLTVDDAGEPLVAVASLYDRLLVFTANKLYAIYGQWPSVAGTGSSLQPPLRVPSPCGCIQPRSVVNTPKGVMFQSKRGIELAGPDSSVSFVGMPVSVTTKAYPICTSAVYDDTSSLVRFTFVQNESVPATGKGVIVNYDVRRERWAVHQVTLGGQGAGAAGAPVETAYVHPVYGYVEGHNDVAGGTYAIIARENTTVDTAPWLDFGVYFVPLTVTTAWYKPSDTQGWGRVRRVRALCTYYDAHGLSATFNTDYRSNPDVHAYSSQLVAQFVQGSQEQVRFAPVHAQCEAMQVTLTTVAPIAPQVVGTGRGAGFTGLAFETIQKKGGYRRTPGMAET